MGNPPYDRLPVVPVAQNTELRNYPFLKLYVQRFRDSDLAHSGNLAAVGAATLLWCVAWHQVPAGSLPDDDQFLASCVYLSPAEWRKIKKVVMRKWYKCDDGRLYHPVLAEIVAEVWQEKLKKLAISAKRSASGRKGGRPKKNA